MPRRPLRTNEQATVDSLHSLHQEALSNLLVAQQTILDELQEDRRSTPTGMVHHYTGRGGMEGIIDTGTLRLSDYTSMIDTGEIQFAFQIGMRVLRQVYEDGPRTGRLRRFVEGTEAIGLYGLPRFFRAFILSLTTNGDASQQWELYAERSTGYCLGFDGPTLDQAFVEYQRVMRLEAGGSFEVVYSEELCETYMRRYVTNALDAVLWLAERPSLAEAARDAMKEIGVNLVFAFIFTALFFKHSGYVAEGEYRFLVMTLPDNPVPGLQVRTNRDGQQIDYYAFDWRSQFAHALKQIRIGPGVVESEGRQIVAEALNRADLTADVLMSGMPRVRVRRAS